ncbi:MAG: hypothetical protein V4662_13675 [Verrucomicrobiota bacterium]
MNLAILLAALEVALSPEVTAAKGKLVVADSEVDVFDALSLDADRWCMYLVPSGGELTEEQDLGGYCVETLSIFLKVPKPLTASSSKGLHKEEGVNRGTPFMSRLAWVISQMRGITMESEQVDTECSRALRFQDWDWVRVDGMPALIRTARLRFKCHLILDEPDTGLSASLTTASGLRITLEGEYLIVRSGDGTITKRVRLINPA